MMGGVSPETCWAIKKHLNNKFYYTVPSCWFFLWDLYDDARIHEHQNLLRVHPKKAHVATLVLTNAKIITVIHLTLWPPVKNKCFLGILDSKWIPYKMLRLINYGYTPKGSRFACIFVHACQGYAIPGPEELRKNCHCSNPCACCDFPIRSIDELQNAAWPARPECMWRTTMLWQFVLSSSGTDATALHTLLTL